MAEKSIFNNQYVMGDVSKGVIDLYNNLEADKKVEFLQRLQRRRLGDPVCQECPDETENKNFSLCNLCNILFEIKDGFELEREMRLVK